MLDLIFKVLVAQTEVAHEVLSNGRDAHLWQLLMDNLQQILHILIPLVPNRSLNTIA